MDEKASVERNDQMKTAALILITMATTLTAWADDVQSCETTEAISFPIKFGSIEVPAASTVKVLSATNVTLTVTFKDMTNSIPASKTDYDKRVQAIRFKTIKVDGVEYYDCKFSNATATDVEVIHRTGIMTVKLASLDDQHQKALGYDPKKAAEAEAKVAAAKAEADEKA